MTDFVSVAQECVEAVREGLEAQDVSAVTRQAHKLKSSARTVGAHGLADVCVALEDAGKAGDEKALSILIPQIEPLMAALDGYVRAL